MSNDNLILHEKAVPDKWFFYTKRQYLKEQPNSRHKRNGQDEEAVAPVGELLYKAQAYDKAKYNGRSHQERCQECDSSDIVPQENVKGQFHYIYQKTEEGRCPYKLFLWQVQKEHIGQEPPAIFSSSLSSSSIS